ncbi:MAG: TM2 domain-containing protein [Clostridia bacterium]|nr:TM2 domain-containing protein [Clostridia bacterium]
MATFINCPQCNSEISDTAISCPKCGAPINNKEDKEIKNKIDLFIAINHKYFPQHTIPQIKELLTKNPDKVTMAMSIEYKNPTTAFILSFFLAAGRIYIGNIGLGIFLLIFVWIFGWLLIPIIWNIIDLFIIMGATRKRNYKQLMIFLQ